MEIFSKPDGLNVQIISAEQQENDRKEAKRKARQNAEIARKEATIARKEANNAINGNFRKQGLNTIAKGKEMKASRLETRAALTFGGKSRRRKRRKSVRR